MKALETDLFGDPVVAPASGPLAREFGVPPFSVLNARDGDWQARKRTWLALGIESEIGRGASRPHGRDTRPTEYGAGDKYKGGDCWTGQRSHTGASGRAMELAGGFSESHGAGASVFDPVLCELAYTWFCPEGGQVVDPFAGGSVRGIVAEYLGRRYWGCDLSARQIEANEEQATRIVPESCPTWVVGDAVDVLGQAPRADFVFACPPYGSLEVYSDDPRDLSAMDHHAFVAAYRRVILRACERLKPDRFACFVVGDFRNPKTGHYRDFVSTTISAFREQGLALYNEAILVTAVGSLPIRIGKQFRAGRKLGKTHQNMLVFVKGDAKKAAQACEETT